MNQPPTLEDIKIAHQRVKPYIHHTPIMTCQFFNHLTGATLFFKCENFQKTGSFKVRGACNTVFVLSDSEAEKGVITHSSGNHAAALAMAASLRKIPAYIIMPDDAPKIKQATVKGFGGQVTLTPQKMREQTMEEIREKTGATVVHPFDDYRVITGQGTIALEILDAIQNLDIILVPVGGCGLISGIAIAAKTLHPKIKIIAVEPSGADDTYRSIKAGHRITDTEHKTIADGLRMTIGVRNFPIVQQYVDNIVTVSEEGISNAMRKIWETMKIIVEPSGAVPFAALLENKIDVKNKRVALVLTGGNVDLDKLPWQSNLNIA